MTGSSPPTDPLPTRLAVGLVIIAACFLGFAHETDAPWEGTALKQVAKALDLPKNEVPRDVFYDFEKLGSFPLSVDAYQQIGLWYAAIVVGVILGLAALTTRWWVPLIRLRPKVDGKNAPANFRPTQVDWIGLGLILLVALSIRVPHLDRAIYFDEQDNLRRNFHGHLEVRPDGTEFWRGAGLREALWENRLGNNPVFLSVACQASLSIWRAFTGADRQQFDIVALRMPVLLAGIASIAALWWLLQIWGLRFAAAFAGLLAAVHPMHIDYSLQARGYAFVLLFVPLAMGFSWLALKRDLWRDWFGLAFSVFFCLWSYAGSIYFALALNAGLLALLLWWRLRSKDPGALGPISRLLSVNAVTGLLYLFLISPHLPQVSYHFRQVFEMIPLQAFWTFYAWSHYSTGTNFPTGEDIYDLRTDAATLPEVLLQRFAPAEPVLVAMQWVLIPALIIVGIFWLIRRSRDDARLSLTAFVLGLGFAAPVIALIHQQFTSLYFYYWYLSYALPVIIVGIAIGFERLILPLLRDGKSQKRLALAAVASAAFFALFVWQTWSGLGRGGRIAQNSKWPLNEEGDATVEFQRATSHWITTRDGQSIRLRDAYDATGARRAGR